MPRARKGARKIARERHHTWRGGEGYHHVVFDEGDEGRTQSDATKVSAVVFALEVIDKPRIIKVKVHGPLLLRVVQRAREHCYWAVLRLRKSVLVLRREANENSCSQSHQGVVRRDE